MACRRRLGSSKCGNPECIASSSLSLEVFLRADVFFPSSSRVGVTLGTLPKILFLGCRRLTFAKAFPPYVYPAGTLRLGGG